ncbi:YraN family protein [Thalassovita sp.]|jgi:putative endonuclease|uniref:YraN family protein n=1 Tax=Thalassovita sp. TaxID=1979401 RepID=UPI003B59699E
MKAKPDAHRRRQGQMAHCFGQSAEEQVARDYERRGATVQARRWRSQAGEIDLVLQHGDELIFVEVKASKSLETAMNSLRPAQMSRILRSAEAYLQHLPTGSLTNVRFDLACCDGQGRPQIFENAFGHF